MKNTLTLNERKVIKTLVLESKGVLTEGMLTDITNYIKRKFSPKKTDEIKQELTQSLGVDENSSKEEIENAILEKTDGGTKPGLVKRALKEVLGFAAFSAVWDVTSYIIAGAVVASDFNPVAIIAAIIYILFSNTDTYEKGRRKVLGPKIDKFIFGKRTHLGDYDDEKKEPKNESTKKTIKLTESDLIRIIKKIINESDKKTISEQTTLLNIPSKNIGFFAGNNAKQILLKGPADPKTGKSLTLRYNISGSYKFVGFDVELRNIKRTSDGGLRAEARPSNNMVYGLVKKFVPKENLTPDGWLYVFVDKQKIDNAIMELKNNNGSEAEIDAGNGVTIELSLTQ